MKYCKNCKHLSISDYIFKDETRSVSCSFHKKFFCFINKDVQRKYIKLNGKIVHVGTSTSLAGARKMIKEWRKINDLD